MSQDKAIVEIRGLTKQFKKKAAVEGVDWNLLPNRIIGLLGANGAGKSTLIRHIIGLYLPTSGTCTTFGCDSAKLGPAELSRIGYVHQEGDLVDWMTAGQLIRYVAGLFVYDGHERVLGRCLF